jgi:hypothetical protein
MRRHGSIDLLRILLVILSGSATLSLHATSLNITFSDPGTASTLTGNGPAGVEGSGIGGGGVINFANDLPPGADCTACTLDFSTGPLTGVQITTPGSGTGVFDFGPGGSFTVWGPSGAGPQTAWLSGTFLENATLLASPTTGWDLFAFGATIDPNGIDYADFPPGIAPVSTSFNTGTLVLFGSNPLTINQRASNDDPLCSEDETVCFSNSGPIGGIADFSDVTAPPSFPISTAVPEPSSFPMLGGGLVSLGLLARRKRS